MNSHIKKRVKRNKRLRIRKHVRKLPLKTKLRFLGITLDQWLTKKAETNGL